MRKEHLYRKRDKSLRDKFGVIAEDYEKYRFSYPDVLFDDIDCYVSTGNKALEIGIGTGKATPMFIQNGYEIVAIDPVMSMLEIAKRKLGDNQIKFVYSTFEDLEVLEQYDLIYAASSFQWVNKSDRLDKVYSLLKAGGAFARFKTVNIIDEIKHSCNKKLIDIYNKYLPDYLPTDKNAKHMSNLEYEQAGFWDFKQKEYYIDHELEIDIYLKLINTYTEYLALDEEIRNKFELCIRDELEGKNVVITQKCSLFLARK